MKGRFTIRRILLVMAAAGCVGVNSQAIAAAFQLWEQDGASVGNYHAGRAAAAEDASTAFYNPAGLVRIQNQQIVFGVVPILTDFKVKGSLAFTTNDPAPPYPAGQQQNFNVQGGTFNTVPNFHYAAPITDNVVFGLSVVAPFGLQINYGADTVLRYALMYASLKVVDISPALGVAINNRLSLGAGIDIERANAEFNVMAGDNQTTVNDDTVSYNSGSSNALGFHVGTLYQLTPHLRFGLSYQSKIVHKIRGSSKFIGPLANNALGGVQYTDALRTRIILPATTSLSTFYEINPKLDLMSSLSYTQWASVKELILQNVAAIKGIVSQNDIIVRIPQNYNNTWNISLGANYHLNEQLMFRTGIGFDKTPTNNRDRNVALPDSNRFAIALGSHYQWSQTLGFDLGWTHIFAANTRITDNLTTMGDQELVTNASIKANADVYGFQIKWDIA